MPLWIVKDVITVTKGGNGPNAFHHKDKQKNEEKYFHFRFFLPTVYISHHIQVLIKMSLKN